jgi:hypothetical protein
MIHERTFYNTKTIPMEGIEGMTIWGQPGDVKLCFPRNFLILNDHLLLSYPAFRTDCSRLALVFGGGLVGQSSCSCPTAPFMIVLWAVLVGRHDKITDVRRTRARGDTL